MNIHLSNGIIHNTERTYLHTYIHTKRKYEENHIYKRNFVVKKKKVKNHIISINIIIQKCKEDN